MTINYDLYPTNYRHAAAYATLIVKATVYNKPFTFLKNPLTLFFKFPGQFHNFRDAGTKYQNPGLSRTIGDVWHVWSLFTLKHLQISTNQYQSWPQYMYPLSLG